jgi:tight adherence protein B
MDLGLGLFILVLFVAIVLLVEGGYLLWNDYKGPEVRQLARRLRTLSAGEHGEDAYSLLKARRNLSQTPWVDRILINLPRVSVFDRWLVQTGLNVSVGQFVFLTVSAAVAAFLVTLVIGFGIAVAVAFGLIGGAIPWLVLGRARTRRLAKFDEQLPDALDLMSRALRAGHAFPSALQMVGSESADPIATEFAETFEEINYGVSLNDAMMNLATRIPSMDLRYFIISVILQRETGGNLSELLGNLSHLIRERFKLFGKIRVLSAEGKLSAYILIALPFCTAGMILLVNPEFLSVLWTDPAGLKAIGGAVAMMLIGAFWMSRIIKIRV